MLYIVSTPIGNLADITYRAVETLKKSDLILCEDCRNSAKLLNFYGVKSKLESFHEHNEDESISRVVDLYNNGKTISLISDAGTPLICDPGFKLVRYFKQHNLNFSHIGGVSSVIWALVISSIPVDKFSFIGFLSKKNQKAKEDIINFKNNYSSIVFFESPKRVIYTIEMLSQIYDENHTISLCKELSKLNENSYTGSISKIRSLIQKNEIICKGEFVFIIAPEELTKTKPNDESLYNETKILLDKFNLKQACKIIAEKYIIKTTYVYNTFIKYAKK